MRSPAVDQYLIAIHENYQASSKKEKTKMLDHAEMATKRSRKQLIRRLGQDPTELLAAKRSGRPEKYSKELLAPHLEFLWHQMERISPRRMKAALADWLPAYKECPGHLRLEMQKMSASTLGRYLGEAREKLIVKKGLSTTSPARHMKNKVPINTLDRHVKKPGYTQTDTVAHCGDNAKGPFISSLTVTDIFSAWTCNRAMFTKKGIEVKKSFRSIETELPFHLLAINSDSGSEFLNKNMLQYTNHGQRIEFTRSRPYKKNDNCYVEQKNFTHVRELFGYERLEQEELIMLMNEIYKEYWNPLQNYFLPTFKLKEKIRVGSKIVKKYDTPMTPYKRLILSDDLKKEQKEQLTEIKLKMNPFELKKGLEAKLKIFFEKVRKQNIRKVA